MEESRIDLVVQFEQWDETKFYDRLGIEDHHIDIMGVEIPCVTIPVRPGRNLASIVEVAAMNNRHRRYGFNAAQELAQRVDITMANLSILKNNKARAVRFSTLEAICKALDCQPGDILEYVPEEE